MFQQIFIKIYPISNQNHHILIKKYVKLIFLCYKYKYLYRYLNEFTVLEGATAPLIPPLLTYGLARWLKPVGVWWYH
jgi:hypothetical protein